MYLGIRGVAGSALTAYVAGGAGCVGCYALPWFVPGDRSANLNPVSFRPQVCIKISVSCKNGKTGLGF